MSFYSSSFTVRLGAGSVLFAVCKTKFGGRMPTRFHLNAVLGNKDGHFVWGFTNFSDSAQNIRLDGSVLRAQLRDSAGSWKEASFDLDGHLVNHNGKLEAVDLPCILAVPDHVIPEVIEQFSVALDNNPGWKVQAAKEPEGNTIFYVNAQAENKTDTVFKTFR